jgi:hypothetical protein
MFGPCIILAAGRGANHHVKASMRAPGRCIQPVLIIHVRQKRLVFLDD